jgi:broad specificity phosphatase PhoE
MSLHYDGCRVLVISHQVVVLCLRYLLEQMTEEQILQIDAERDVANCGVTEYRLDPEQGTHGGLVLNRYNFVAPLKKAGAPITAQPDAPVGAR